MEIGGVVATVTPPHCPELVPRGYLPQNREYPQELMVHLRWMLQKDLLKQDMFLIGPPGGSRRLLSMRFCELLGREVEYVAISQDTTESDLKQRREIIDGAAIFADQAPVRAAIHGRVLVIDGLEKAERNVLPTLNNLLENREMTLDDGRFLMKAESYDALLAAGYSNGDLKKQNLVRVHPDFRVIALGVPVPPYPGRTLDPPLRSRFQARNVQPSSPGTQLESLIAVAPNVPLATLEKLVGIREAVNTIESMHEALPGGQRMPHFDFLSLSHCARVLDNFPNTSVPSTVRRVFPVTKEIASGKAVANAETLDRILKKYSSGLVETKYAIASIAKSSAPPNHMDVKFRSMDDEASSRVISVTCGSTKPHDTPPKGFVETELHAHALVQMIQDHAVGSDMCILGPKGSGKSDLARLFAHRLGYATELFSLFKDMTARDLLQRRSTDNAGNTQWEDSPLVHAARHGHLAILDGVHRLGSDSLGVLQRLVQDREIDLADGVKLLAQHKYDEILKEKQHADASITELANVFPIHPSFRIIAIAESEPSSKAKTAAMDRESTSAWLNSDSIALFSFHTLPTLSRSHQNQIVRALYPRLPEETAQMVLNFAEQLQKAKKESADADYQPLNLSLRQLLRVCRRLNAFPQQSLQDLRPLIHDTMLTQFLPASCTRLVDKLLSECGAPQVANASARATESSTVDTIRQENGKLCIGDVCHPIQTPAQPELVPQPHYFDIPKHTETMKGMLQDVVAGQKHLLLIGNQGVGKNKLADRLLQLLQQEREYIQLHRDTTVQTLTLVPNLVDGRIVWEDSPLVRAAKTGRTLVVDEADKAPLEVVCVLKGLIEDGEMLLGNGMRLIDPEKVDVEDWHDEQNIIKLHPNFRMWVLANRPGFPFLGNNFFREIGDVFASHAIDNPDEASELALLQAYAPSVSVDILRRICTAFAELRELVDNGTITYPYSTREAVAVAKHLEKFPQDGVTSVLENVLAFDAYDKNLRKQLSEVFLRHGIPLSPVSGQPLRMQVRLAESTELPPLQHTATWDWGDASDAVVVDFSIPKRQLPSFAVQSTLPRRKIWFDPATTRSFGVQQQRVHEFTEEVASFRVPLKGNRKQRAHGMVVFPDDSVHVLTTNPMSLHSFSNYESGERTHKVLEIEGQYMQWESRPVVVGMPASRQVGVFIPSTGLSIIINPDTNADGRAECFTLPDGAIDGQIHTANGSDGKKRKQNPFTQWFSSGSQSGAWRTTNGDDASNPGVIVRYQQGGSIVQFIDFASGKFYSMDLASSLRGEAEGITNVQAMGANTWLLQSSQDSVALTIERRGKQFSINQVNVTKEVDSVDLTYSIFPSWSKAGPTTTAVHPQALIQQIDGSRGQSRVLSALRGPDNERWGIDGAWAAVETGDVMVNAKTDEVAADLEVTDRNKMKTKTIVLHTGTSDKQGTRLPRVVGAAAFSDGTRLATLEDEGSLRVWQLDSAAIDEELNLWKQMFGVSDDDTEHLSIKINGTTMSSPESIPKTGLDAPKHGKEDEKNEPHVGGNTWAGGTGGSDTAGLGGRGGPYRLDKGHKVHQISQAKKDEVSAEARAKARAMAEQALAERLQEINMTEKEWATYEAYFARVEHESSQLRSILDNLESFAQERSWLRHQSSGELDDAKLVDGVTGERLVFKRRGTSDSPFQTMHQSKPKRMVFVMDVSGSMYRFNGQDGRLERVLETSLMIMESFAGFESKFDYCIMGHSGDSPEIPFVEFGTPPANRKERLKVLQRMVAHSQYCMSGDHTVEAIDKAVQLAVDQEGDDYYVFVVSDANLERYGINPRRLGRQLITDPRVKAHAIFIASFADEAARIMKELPSGRSHVCLNTTELPRTFKKIFTSAFNH